jgi:hypothetical protein
MTKQEVFFKDDPVMGTYPEYGKRSKMLELFKSHDAIIIHFDKTPRDDNGYPENRKANRFIKNNPDYQVYTIISKDGWGGYPLYMDRGWHLCNSEYKYVAVKDPNYKVMRYEE